MLQEVVHNFLGKYGLLQQKVLCGFSGGADSTSLVLALSRENVQLTAVHFQHGIRGEEAEADAEWCRCFCRERKIALEVQYLDVPHHSFPGECVEEAARRLRLESWQRLSAGELPIMLAHHADDVLEELFLRLARGSNVGAIVPMKPHRNLLGMDIYRPLLALRRKDIEAWLHENGVDDWRIDSTNLDNDYRRNAVRNLMLPLFRRIFDTDAGLLRSIDNLSQDASYLDEAAEHLALDGIEAWQKLHPSMLYRAMRRLLAEQFVSMPSLTSSFMERLITTLSSFSGRPCCIPLNKDVTIKVDCGGVHVRKKMPAWENIEWNWRSQSSVKLPGWQIQIVDELGKDTEAFDEKFLTNTIVIRHRQNGDRMIPFGAENSKKLQDLFTDAKLPRELRDFWPILQCNNEIIWIPGVRRAQFAPVTQDSHPIFIQAVRL